VSNGKGDSQRPLSVTPATYAANYARINWHDTPCESRPEGTPLEGTDTPTTPARTPLDPESKVEN
jgi:hypothetical protein